MTFNLPLDVDQVNMILKALTERENRCRSNAKMIARSGYGKGSTEIKAENMQKEANEIGELLSYISTETAH